MSEAERRAFTLAVLEQQPYGEVASRLGWSREQVKVYVHRARRRAIGVFGAGAVLLLTRPRVRAGKQGVVVRNVLGDNEFSWEHIRGVSFPDRKAWARLELVNDDYVPMLAIRSNDGDHAAAALERLRELGAKYSVGDASK